MPSLEYKENTQTCVSAAVTTEDDRNLNICALCKKLPIDRSENENSYLCTECRERCIKYPAPKKIVIVAIIIALLFLASLIKLPESVKYLELYKGASNKAESGDIRGAYSDLKRVLKKYPTSMHVAIKLTDLYMDAGWYEEANSTIKKYLSGKEDDSDEVKRINGYIKKIKKYSYTNEKINNIINSTPNGLTTPEDYKYVEEQLDQLLLDNKQDKALVYYALYLYSTSKDIEVRKGYLQECLTADQTYLDAKAYLAAIYRYQGDFKTSRNLCEEILKKDSKNPQALRVLSTIEMLEGNKSKAVAYAQKAYDTDPEGLYVPETLIIALNEDGQNSKVEKLKSEYINIYGSFDNDTLGYFQGKISLRDYYVGAEG